MSDIPNSTSYTQFLNDIKKDAKESRLNAHLLINKETVSLFYRIGKNLLEKQSKDNWDTECIEQLAIDLKNHFPEMKSLSLDELKTMKILAGHFSENELSMQKIDYISWSLLRILLNTFDSKQVVIWYVQKCLKESWRIDDLIKGMEEKIHEQE